MSFPFGRPILALLACSLLAGLAIHFRRPPARADITLWVFADLHARMYRDDSHSPSLIDDFQKRTGKSVRLDLITAPALDVRLLSLYMFAQGYKTGADSASPDLVEVPLQSIGKYFRPPVNEVGFLPLNGYLDRSGWKNQIVQSRFSPWSKDGIIFGIPHDLHPCTLTYRKDLFFQAGIDLQTLQTWPQLQESCLQFQHYWQEHGHPRTALALSSAAPDMLLVMLHQQHVELVGADLSLHFTDPKVVQTLCWYALAVAGPQKIGTDLNPAAGQSAVDLSKGDTCALITPDWLVADLKQYGPDLAGKLCMIPLPRFSRDDARTASWGGTMIGITRTCPDPDSAWKLIESLYLTRNAIRIQKAATGILPPIPEYWSDPIYHQPDPFFDQQRIDELYIHLAGELPDVKMTPYTMQAQTFLTIALNQIVAKVRSNGSAGLISFCRQSLADAQSHMQEMIRFSN